VKARSATLKKCEDCAGAGHGVPLSPRLEKLLGLREGWDAPQGGRAREAPGPMSSFATALLLALSAALGVRDAPPPDPTWRVVQPWIERGGAHRFVAESETLPIACREGGVVAFPLLVHGAHRVWVDGRLVGEFGDPTFRSVDQTYNAPSLSCSLLHGGVVRWEAVSYSAYFARALHYPERRAHAGAFRLLGPTVWLMSAGALLALGAFFLAVFSVLPRRYVWAFAGTCAGWFVFFTCAAGGGPFFEASMLIVHKVGDIGLWVGMALIFSCFREEGWLPARVTLMCQGLFAAAVLLMVAAEDGDTIQLGTTIGFPPAGLGICWAAFAIVRDAVRNRKLDQRRALTLSALLVFLGTSLHDIGLTLGLFSGSLLTPVGFLGGMLALGLAVSVRVNEIFAERERLRLHLEEEVERKTAQLERSMEETRVTQERRLQWLGLMASFLRHELKNATVGLQTSLALLRRRSREGGQYLARADRSLLQMRTLLDAVARASSVETLVSEAKHGPVDLTRVLCERVDDLAAIHAGTPIESRVEQGLHVQGNAELLELLLDKLVNNAVEHSNPGAAVSLTAIRRGGHAVLEVRNQGDPLPDAGDRIFELAFSTKDASSEHFGIGLYVARLIAEAHGGHIRARSESESAGACFEVEVALARGQASAARENTRSPS
jgi:signal transduction histidine kinase